MTVKELIEILSEYPEDAEVWLVTATDDYSVSNVYEGYGGIIKIE